MTQNFVLAFGGTGARCAEALTYLVASRSIAEPVHLLLIDPDETNGNVSIAIAQLRRYREVHRCLRRGAGTHTQPFFSTPINADLGPDSYFWANPQPNVPFQTLIEYSAQSPAERGLLDLLYDQSDLELSFEKGYVGRAHIGSLDLLRVLQHQIQSAAKSPDAPRGRPDSIQVFFHGLRAATQQPGGARLLVVGSVFGGTGASGLPAVPPLLRQVLLSGLQEQLALGCVQIAPYFSFPPGRVEDPDSALHPLATQAALFHYSLTDVGYDRIYLVGAPTRQQSNEENVPGGESQRNKAHYVELAAALAAAHFFEQPPRGMRGEVVASGTEEISWEKLPHHESTRVKHNLVAFGTFCMMHSRFLAQELEERRHLGTKWLADLESGRERTLGGQESELRELRDFSTRFLIWAQQVQSSHGVLLFSLGNRETEDSLAHVTGGGDGTRPYHEIYRRLSIVGDLDQENGQGWYVDALTRAVEGFCRSNYTSWWV